jgi:hypothetical protein
LAGAARIPAAPDFGSEAVELLRSAPELLQAARSGSRRSRRRAVRRMSTSGMAGDASETQGGTAALLLSATERSRLGIDQ